MSEATSGVDRIRSFSRVTWTVGTVVVMAIALLTFPQIYQEPGGAIYVDGGDYPEREYPWYAEDPAELEIVDGVVRGDAGGGFLPFPASSSPMRLTPVRDLPDLLGVSQSVAPWTEESDPPSSLGYLYEPDEIAYLVPSTEDGRIWFSTVAPQWEAEVTVVDAEEISGGSTSGQGDAILQYRGEALSARFQHEGTGIFQVTVAAPGETERAVNEVDDVDARASWDTAGVVLFIIEAPSGDGTWTVTVNE